MKIERTRAVELLQAFGVYTATDWDSTKLQAQIDDPEVMTGYAQGNPNPPALYAEVRAAHERNERVIVTPDGSYRRAPKKLRLPPLVGPKRLPEVGHHRALLEDWKVRPRRFVKQDGSTLISVVFQELLHAGKTGGYVTQKQLLEALQFRFPDRDASGMAVTTHNLVASKLRQMYGVPVKSRQLGFCVKGYWIDEADLPKPEQQVPPTIEGV